MSLTAVVLAVAAAAAFPLLLWAIGRTVTAIGERAPYSRGRAHHYMAERLDGALMLADPVLGGNAACEPATTVTWQARKRTVSQDQSPADDS